MKKQSIMALAIVTGALSLTSTQLLANDGDFRVCRPYRAEVRDLNSAITNFESEVMAPLRNELRIANQRVSDRQSLERKLENVVSSIEKTIRNSESRLRTNPASINSNRNAIVASNTKITSLNGDIARWTAEMDDVGFIKRGRLKRKIKKAKKEIDSLRNSITRANRDITTMEQELNTLPGHIASERARLATAEQRLNEHRNLKPSIDQLRDSQRAAGNRLDSQEDIKRQYRQNLLVADRELSQCMRIDKDARVYSYLAPMSRRLKKTNCELELVRNRLPYNAPKAQLIALREAFELTCETAVVPGGHGGGIIK